jgi:hypothetical protein
MTCPSDDDLVELVEGRLDGAELARLKEHVAGCRVCAGVVAGLGSAEVRAGRPSASGVDAPRARDSVAESAHGTSLAMANLIPAGVRIAGRFVIEAHAGLRRDGGRLPREGRADRLSGRAQAATAEL